MSYDIEKKKKLCADVLASLSERASQAQLFRQGFLLETKDNNYIKVVCVLMNCR